MDRPWPQWLEMVNNYSPIDLISILQNAPLFLHGLLNTVLLLVGSLVVAALIALPLSLMRAWRVPVLNQIVFGYVYLFRGTPMLVQLYLLYYGAAQFELIRSPSSGRF